MIRQGKQSQQECLCLFSHIHIQEAPGFGKVWKTVSRVWLSHCLLNLPLAPISLSLPGLNLWSLVPWWNQVDLIQKLPLPMLIQCLWTSCSQTAFLSCNFSMCLVKFTHPILALLSFRFFLRLPFASIHRKDAWLQDRSGWLFCFAFTVKRDALPFCNLESVFLPWWLIYIYIFFQKQKLEEVDFIMGWYVVFSILMLVASERIS